MICPLTLLHMIISPVPPLSQDPVLDGQRGANLIVSCREGGEDVRVVQIQVHAAPCTPGSDSSVPI
jgi:hypothetical protein